jgi:hypothetical protein
LLVKKDTTRASTGNTRPQKMIAGGKISTARERKTIVPDEKIKGKGKIGTIRM